MATKQEALPLVKALAIIMGRCTQCWEARVGEEAIPSNAKPLTGVTQSEKSHLLEKCQQGSSLADISETTGFNLGKNTENEYRKPLCSSIQSGIYVDNGFVQSKDEGHWAVFLIWEVGTGFSSSVCFFSVLIAPSLHRNNTLLPRSCKDLEAIKRAEDHSPRQRQGGGGPGLLPASLSCFRTEARKHGSEGTRKMEMGSHLGWGTAPG